MCIEDINYHNILYPNMSKNRILGFVFLSFGALEMLQIGLSSTFEPEPGHILLFFAGLFFILSGCYLIIRGDSLSEEWDRRLLYPIIFGVLLYTIGTVLGVL